MAPELQEFDEVAIRYHEVTVTDEDYGTVEGYPPGPWPHQRVFHASYAKYRLLVGSYGSGKSKSLLWEGIFHGLEYPGSNSVILRKTIPDLKRTVIDKFLSDIPRHVYSHYNQTDHIVYFHPDPVTRKQSKLFFAACEREEDVGKFLSTEYVFIGFEELGEFPFAIWDALAGRNRCPIPGARPCMAASTNPEGIGWSWIKKLFVDKKPLHGMAEEKYNKAEYEYFHSTVDQNPIYSKDEEYLRTLEKSPKRDVIRWGKLDAVTGNYFDNFAAHHVRKRTDFIFQPWQTFTLGWDYGFSHFACITWLTKAILKPRWEGAEAKMVNVFTRELWLSECTPKQQLDAIVAAIPRDEDHGYTETVDAVHFSWERFMRTTSQVTVADEVGNYLAAAGLPRPISSNKDRVGGWSKMYELLDTDDLFVLDTCPTIAESLPLLMRNPKNLEDVLKPKGVSLADDMGDAARYAIAGALLDPDDVPKEEQFRKRLEKIKDPLARFTEQYKEYNRQNAAMKSGARQKSAPSWMRRTGIVK
jgi:phage terminase large subunit